VKRVKTGLCLLAAASAMALALATPAGAAGADRTGAASATGAGPALVPAHGPVPAATRTVNRHGSVTPDADQDGACNTYGNGDGDFCYWFSTNFVGSMSDFFFSDANLGNNIFLTPGLGLGQVVANDSESALNADSNLAVIVFTGANFSGTAGFINPRQFGNFNSTFTNNVESHEFF
jgi:Peptidase inhibitor family I36